MAEQASAPASGHELLSRISNEIVRAQKQYFGRGPDSAKSYMLDDLLFVVMRGGMTVAEQTMLDFGRGEEVRAFRQAYQDEMTGPLTRIVEELTGRKVVTYQSQVLFEPHLILEVFVFDEEGPVDARQATVEDVEP